MRWHLVVVPSNLGDNNSQMVIQMDSWCFGLLWKSGDYPTATRICSFSFGYLLDFKAPNPWMKHVSKLRYTEFLAAVPSNATRGVWSWRYFDDNLPSNMVESHPIVKHICINDATFGGTYFPFP